MARVRLQVRVLPLEDPASFPTAKAYEDAMIKLPVNCTDDDTIGDLHDKLQGKWEAIRFGKGPLSVRRFETGQRDLLVMGDRIGDFFDDRRPTEEKVPITSIVLVHRYPPDPVELPNMQRFGSLMPDSAARPCKRPLPDVIDVRPYRIERWSAGLPNLIETRQRTHGLRLNSIVNPEEPVLSREGYMEGYHTSQGSGDTASIHQVVDSQILERKRHPIPYGTPTSLSVISPQARVPPNQTKIATIPDSPISRERQPIDGILGHTILHGRESTKSESPELRASIHEGIPMDKYKASVPFGQTNDDACEAHREGHASFPGLDQTNHSDNVGRAPTTPFTPLFMPAPKSIQQMVNAFAGNSKEVEPQRVEEMSIPSQTSLKRKARSLDTTFGGQVAHLVNGDVYDPIESDTESFHENQGMRSAKRLKLGHSALGRSASRRPPLSLSTDHRDSEHLVTSVPIPQDNHGRASLSQLSVLDHDNTDAPHGDDFNHMHNRLDQIQDMALEQQAREHLTANGPWGGHQNSLQATTAESQNPEEATEKRQTINFEKELEDIMEPEIERDIGTGSSADDHGPQNTRRLAEEAQLEELAQVGQHRQMKATEEKIAEAKRTEETKAKEKHLLHEKKNAARLAHERQSREKALSHQAEKMMLAVDGAKQLKVEKLEKNKAQPTPKPEPTTAVGLGPKGNINAGMTAKEAQPVAADAGEMTTGEPVSKGAKPAQTILTETLPVASSNPSERTPARTVLTGATAPGATKLPKFKPQTEEQKARRKKLGAQKQADKAEAAEEKKIREAQRARRTAQGLAQANADEAIHEAKTSSKNAKIKGEEKTLKQQNQTSEGRSRQSSMPCEPSSISSRHRKTMTPVLPKLATTKPSSAQGDLVPSSPLAARSANTNTPLRSALKQSSRALRRSVSFLDGQESVAGRKDGIPSGQLTSLSDTFARRPVKSLLEIHKELASTTPATSNPAKTLLDIKGSESKVPKLPVTNKKEVQTKLKVIRDKKGKGRAFGSPPRTQSTPTQEVETSSASSDEDSTASYFPEEDRNAKAGPRPRKLVRGSKCELSKASAKEAAPFRLIDPKIKKSKVENTPSTPALPASHSCLSSKQVRSRSPTRHTIATVSCNPKSGSSSRSESDSGSEKDSPSDSDEESTSSSSEEPADTATGKTSSFPSKGCSPAVEMDIPASGGAGEEKPASQVFQKLDRHGRLPNGTRPAYYKYPSLSEYKEMAEADSIYDVPVHSRKTTTPARGFELSGSSSDDESSSLDDDEAVNGSQASSKKTSGRIPGLKGLMKLVMQVRGGDK